MVIDVWRPVKVDVAAIRLVLPILSGTEHIPADFPGRQGDTLTLVIDVSPMSDAETGRALGRVRGWPSGYGAFEVYMPAGRGTYEILGPGDIVIGRYSGCGIPAWAPCCTSNAVWLDVDAEGWIEEPIAVGVVGLFNHWLAMDWPAL